MNVIKSYDKLSQELREGLNSYYPNGYEGFTSKVELGDGKYLVIPYVVNDTSYLVKIKKLKVDGEKEFDPSKIQMSAPEDDDEF